LLMLLLANERFRNCLSAVLNGLDPQSI